MKTDRELLKDANELIRSFNSVINRKGEKTNWESLGNKTNTILKEQHLVLGFEAQESVAFANFIAKQTEIFEGKYFAFKKDIERKGGNVTEKELLNAETLYAVYKAWQEDDERGV